MAAARRPLHVCGMEMPGLAMQADRAIPLAWQMPAPRGIGGHDSRELAVGKRLR